MRLENFHIKSYKNLKDVSIDFDEKEWITVVIGWNGTGKSNVLEALVILFRDLIMGKDQHGKADRPSFKYVLQYECHGKYIEIDADPERSDDAFKINYRPLDSCLNAEKDTQPSLFESDDTTLIPLKFSQFKKQSDEFIPRFVFGYYSGHSDRMQAAFQPYEQQYYKQLINNKTADPGFRRLFYALPVHSHFVLLAFILQKDDNLVNEFLDKQLGIETDIESGSLDSVLVVLNKPSWARKENQNDIFWGASGVARQFLDKVHKHAVAPIRLNQTVDSIFSSNKKREHLYLYIKDLEGLQNIRGDQTPRDFFRDIESTYFSDLISEVRIRVKLRKNDGSVTFRELSEGEQQLLTVLGLMRFTAEEESLFLLDEPDTHLNPSWSVNYIDYLKNFTNSGADNDSSSHIVLTTHNPVAIAELKKQQVQILNRDKDDLTISAQEPAFDPRGMGYAGIMTSDMFGLVAALDTHTQELLEEKRVLSLEDDLSTTQKDRLDTINLELEGYGFRYASRDPVFEEYLRARYEHDSSRLVENTSSELTQEERMKIARKLIQKVIAKGNNDALD